MVDDKIQAWAHLIDFHDITDQDVKEIVRHRDEEGNEVDPVNTDHSDAARRAILRLYSMETPLYSTLNRATGFRDERAIPTLGPYAYLLYCTIALPPPENAKK